MYVESIVFNFDMKCVIKNSKSKKCLECYTSYKYMFYVETAVIVGSNKSSLFLATGSKAFQRFMYKTDPS